MDTPLPLPDPWPKFDFGEPSTRKVETRESAVDGIKTLRGISMFMVILGLIVVFFHSSAKVERMVREGQVVQAKVDEKYVTEDDGDDHFHVRYTYSFEGYGYSGSRSIPKARFDATQPGTRFPITVLPSAPYEHEIGIRGEADVQSTRRFGSLVVLGIAFPFALFALGLRSRIRRERRILTTWNPLPAQVTEITKTTSDGSDFFVVHYRLPLPNGKVVSKKVSVYESVAKRAKPGDFFPVLIPPNELYVQERLRPLSSLSTVRLVSMDPEKGCLRLTD